MATKKVKKLYAVSNIQLKYAGEYISPGTRFEIKESDREEMEKLATIEEVEEAAGKAKAEEDKATEEEGQEGEE